MGALDIPLAAWFFLAQSTDGFDASTCTTSYPLAAATMLAAPV